MGWFSKTSPESSSHPPKQPTRDEQADRDLQNLFKQIQSDSEPKPTSQSSSKALPRSTAAPQSTSSAPLDPISESLLPTTMSCRAAFDSLFYCYSLGGQFTNVYRYGELRDCNEKWSDFWFCMRTRSGTEGSVRERMIRDYYREKERRKYGTPGAGEGKSSEDVWRGRERKVEWGDVFGKEEPGIEEGIEGEKRRVARYLEVGEDDQ